MANRVIYLLKAQIEFDESFDFYEKRLAGLGVRFGNHIKEKVLLISKHPERYARRKGNFRQATVKEFPFLIIYKYQKNKNLILIVSIFHTSRNPRYKYRR